MSNEAMERSRKDETLRHLFSQNVLPSYAARNNFANIYLDKNTRSCNRPILFAESD